MWPRFLVHQILRCTARKPFSSVGVYRDNPGGDAILDDRARKAFKGIVKRQPIKRGEPVRLSETGDPSQQEIASTVFDSDVEPIDVQLPSRVFQNRNPKDRGASRVIEDRSQDRVFATGLGVSPSPLATATLESTPESTGDGKPGTLSFFELTIEALLNADPKRQAVITAQKITVPMEWGAMHPKRLWSLIGSGDRPRRVMVARVTIDDVTSTLFEIERRPTETAQATLSIRGLPTMAELKTMFFICAGNDGRLTDEECEHFQLSHFERGALKHCADTPLAYAAYIFRKLSRPNEHKPGRKADAGDGDAAASG